MSIRATRPVADGGGISEMSGLGPEVRAPFKDTSGPGVSIVIKVMAVVSLLIAPLLS